MSRRFPSPFPLSRSLSRPPPFQTPARPLRFASTSPSFPRRFLSTSLFLGAGVIFVAYYYDTRSIVHERVAMPFLRLVADPEQGHRLAIRLLGLSKWARPRDMGVDGDELQAEVGLSFYPLKRIRAACTRADMVRLSCSG